MFLAQAVPEGRHVALPRRHRVGPLGQAVIERLGCREIGRAHRGLRTVASPGFAVASGAIRLIYLFPLVELAIVQVQRPGVGDHVP